MDSRKVAPWHGRVENHCAMTDKLKYALSALRRIPRLRSGFHSDEVDPRVEQIKDALDDLANGLEEEIASIEEKIKKSHECGP